MGCNRWAAAVAALLMAIPAFPQTLGAPSSLAPGVFLIARRDLGDPNFSKTVVLLIDYSSSGAMGLVVNRQTKLPISRALKDMPEAKDAKEAVFLGGPVDTTSIFALVRSSRKLEGAKQAFPDVYLVSSKDQLAKVIRGSSDEGTFRVYAGYSGWGPGQLDREAEFGSWNIIRADAKTVFDPTPDEVWPRMIRLTELRYVFNRMVPGTVLQSSLH